MAKNGIQISLHGADRFGLNPDNDIVGRRNRIIAPNGMKNLIRYADDFMGDVIADEWNAQKGSDGGTAFAVVNSQIGGVVRMATGAGAGATMAVNGTQLASGVLNWKAANGGLMFETRLKVDVITNLALFVGFTDQDSALEMPFTLSTGTLTSNATDAVGFLFDTAATASTIKLVGVKNDTDATFQDTSIAPVAATFITLRVEIDDQENATFFINHARVGTVMASALTKTIALTPCIAAFARSAAAKNVDVDYIINEMYRV